MCDITKEYIISSYVSDLRDTAMTALQTHHIHTSSHDAIEEENHLQVNIISDKMPYSTDMGSSHIIPKKCKGCQTSA
jgi:hypothetical protein